MKYLLPCKCGQSVEIEPSQAGQTVACGCGENLLVPSMLQIKALPTAQEKPAPQRSKKRIPVTFPFMATILSVVAAVVCLGLTVLFGQIEGDLFYVIFRGCTGAFAIAGIALGIRDWVNLLCQSSEDSTLRRAFFVLGITLLFPTFLLASYLYEWQPNPRLATVKRTQFSYGSNRKPLHQDSTPIPWAEVRILWMEDEEIDRMMPMDLFFYFRTLEEPTFSYNFQDNYEAVKDTYRIWVTANIILFILAVLSIVASFFMPRQTVEVTGWSGSEWR